MPDLMNFKITPLGAANVNVPRATIEGKIVDSSNQSIVLADFTGANALNWPGVLSTFTAAQRLSIAEVIATRVLFIKAGLE